MIYASDMKMKMKKKVFLSCKSNNIQALQEFNKYFFAMDRQNYARMITLYLSEMVTLENSDPAMGHQYMQGSWVIKKSGVPFCALGAD